MTGTTLLERAVQLHQAGMAASDASRPGLAVRRLRAALRLLDAGVAGEAGAAGPVGSADDPAVVAVRCRLLISLAWAESERGRVAVGFRLLDQAEPLAAEDQRPVLCAQRALLLKRAGRYDLALRQFDQAVSRLSEPASPLDLVKALNNRSLVHQDLGNVGQARADLQRCGRIAAANGLALHLTFSQVNLGCLDVVAGDLPAALRAFAAARVDYQSLAPGRLANLAVERARALVGAGLFGEADRELAYAIEESGRRQLSHILADALHVRAEAALLAGRPVAAAAWARQARARFIGRANARRAAIASLLILRAEHAGTSAGTDSGAGADPLRGIAGRGRRLAARLRQLGLVEDARVAALVAARALVAAGQRGPAERLAAQVGTPGRADRLDSRLLWRLARAELASAAGRSVEAARHLAAGMTTLHRYRTQLGCLDLQTGAAVHGRDLARAGLAAALAGRSPAAVFRWSERARAQALLIPPVRPPDHPAAAAALEELRQTRHALRTAELAGRPTAGLPTRIEALQRTVREHSWSAPGPRPGEAAGIVAFPALREELGDAAIVIYLRDGPVLRALVVAGGVPSLVTVGGFAAAEEAVLRLRADLDAAAGRAMPDRLARAVATATAHDADRLAAAVLDPLLDLIGDRELVVVPTGVLTTVPWSRLPGCRGRPVTVAPSATVWHAARHRRSPHGGADPDAATLLVAGPGNARGEAEVRAVAALYPHATVLTGPEATPAATLAAFGRSSLAHLAAHGRHQSENALFSTLDLAGGPVLGYDLQRLRRLPETVILSSCELGLTDIRPGDETVGMVTALLAAGAATVIASVTRVADEAAMAVTVGFHRSVATGRPAAAALADAAAPYPGPAPATGFVCFGSG